MKQQLAGAAVVLSLVAAACSGPGTAGRASPPPEQPAAAMSATELSHWLRDANTALFQDVATRGSAEGLAGAATEDALLLLKGVYTLRGREALRTHLAAHPLEEGGRLRGEAVRWDVSVDGLLGYTAGQALIEGGEAQQRYLRYLTVWSRGDKGPWRLAAAVFNRANGPFERPDPLRVPATGAPPSPPRAPSDTLAEAFAADRAFAEQSVKEGMAVAFPAWATEDAILVGAGLFGRKAIHSGYMTYTRDRVELRWEPRLGGAAPSGDLAYTVGAAVSVSPPNGQSTPAHAKYLTVWQRQADGAWRWVADQGNNSPGPDGP